MIKTLGLIWQTKNDRFRFEQGHDSTKDSQWTRRKLLSMVAKLFYPLGLLAPYIITARMMLQVLVIGQYKMVPMGCTFARRAREWVEDLVQTTCRAERNSSPMLSTRGKFN